MRKLIDKESTDFVTHNLLMNYCIYDDNSLLIESFLKNNELHLDFDLNRYWIILSGINKKYNTINDPLLFHHDTKAAYSLYHRIYGYLEEHHLRGTLMLIKVNNSKIPALFFSFDEKADVTLKDVAETLHQVQKDGRRQSVNGDISRYVTTSAAGPFHGYEGMHQAYAEAERLNELHYFTDADRIITPEIDNTVHDPGIMSVYIQCHLIKTHLCRGTEAQTKKDLHFLFDEVIRRSLNKEYLMSAHISLKETFELFRIVSNVPLNTNYSPDDFFSLHEYEEKTAAVVNRIFALDDKPEFSPDILTVAGYLHMNYAQPVKLNIMAEYLGVNASSLSSQFNKETGMSIPEYVNHIRIDQAEKLLRETEDTIEEIQMKTGFGSLRYFTDTFHRITGRTPLQFRKYARKQPV